MKLYFFRHGHAEDADGPEFDDFARRLTDKGVKRTQTAAQALVKLAIKPARLYSSPRIRARQTADILAKALGISVAIREEVGFGFNTEYIEPLISELEADDEVIFVGHEPDLSIMVSKLVSGGEILMKKGGLARVDLFSREPLRGALVWMIPPRVFDDLAS
jgi:phosphohistidine phosphatase